MAIIQSDTFKRVETKTRQLILQYQTLQAKNDELAKMIDELKVKLLEANKEAKDWKSKYTSLMCAKSVQATEEEMNDIRNKMLRLEREVENCISLLNE